MKDSVLNKKVSMFRSANTPGDVIEVNLLDVLSTKKYEQLAYRCSRIKDKKERSKWKRDNVPCIAVSGLFSYRSANHLIKHSGLICLDLDGVDDIILIKKNVVKLPFVAYCGKSISGTGLFVIIPIPESTAQEHRQRFNSLEQLLISKFDISESFDTNTKDVSRLRFVSFDSEAYFNHSAETYTEIKEESFIAERYAAPRFFNNTTIEKVWKCADIIQERRLDFAPDYDSYIKTGFSIADLGEQGRNIFHAVCQYSPKYDYNHADKTFTKCLKTRNRITIGTFFQYCLDYGITSKSNKWETFKIPAKYELKRPQGWIPPEPSPEPTPLFVSEPPKEDWTAEINELEAFFDNTKLPTGTVPAEQGEVITDSKKFVDSHLTFVKRNNGNPTYLPYLQRLQNFKNYLI